MDVYTERTLLISGSEKGLDAIINFLKGCGYAAVSVVSSGDEARRMLQQDTFSLIVLNTPLKDEFGYQLSLQLTQNTCSGVVMLCKADMAEEMANKTISYGSKCSRFKAFESSGTAASDSDGESDARANDAYESGKRQVAKETRRTAVCIPCKMYLD